MQLYHLPYLASSVWPFLHLFVCTCTIEPPLGIPLLYDTSPSHLSPQLKASKTRYTKDSTLATNQHCRLWYNLLDQVQPLRVMVAPQD